MKHLIKVLNKKNILYFILIGATTIVLFETGRFLGSALAGIVFFVLIQL